MLLLGIILLGEYCIGVRTSRCNKSFGNSVKNATGRPQANRLMEAALQISGLQVYKRKKKERKKKNITKRLKKNLQYHAFVLVFLFFTYQSHCCLKMFSLISCKIYGLYVISLLCLISTRVPGAEIDHCGCC